MSGKATLRDEVLAAVEQLAGQQADDDGAFTAKDLAKQLHSGPDRARAVIHELHEAGLLEVVRLDRPNIAGVRCRRIAYRLKPAGGKGKT